LTTKDFQLEHYIKVSKEAHQLIEEFMLLANKHVAIKMGKPAKK
jgi:exoribonuclease R